MTVDEIMIRCFACDKDFQFGPQRYAGSHIAAYNISVCSTCYAGNWDGWGPLVEPALLLHLDRERIPVPERNEQGWLPRDGQPR